MVSEEVNSLIKPMFSEIYYKLLDDLTKGNKDSVIFKHHIDFVNKNTFYYENNSDESIISPYEKTEPNRIVADFIASMTDDYFIELHEFLFPNSKLKINYKSYFEDLKHS
jgi:dGTPase